MRAGFLRSWLDRARRRLQWLQCVCVCLWTDRRRQDVLDDGMGAKRRVDAAYMLYRDCLLFGKANGEDGASYHPEVRCEC